MPYSTRSGVKIYYEVAGEGPPMILVHANAFDHRLWMYQTASFSKHFRMVAVDLRGYGRSDKPTDPFSLGDMAADVTGVCANEGIDEAIFLGASTGAGICLLIGQSQPPLVRGLVLVGGSSRGPSSMNNRIEGFLSGDIPAYHERYLRECVTEDFAATNRGAWILSLFSEGSRQLSGASIAQIFRARMACDLTKDLQKVRAPTLVVNGEMDMSLAAGRETAAGIPGATHIIIPGSGHLCNIEKPAEFDRAVKNFLIEKNCGLLDIRNFARVARLPEANVPASSYRGDHRSEKVATSSTSCYSSKRTL
jgi:pimeloyl-ACP methyl ester carboxylesterase